MVPQTHWRSLVNQLSEASLGDQSSVTMRPDSAMWCEYCGLADRAADFVEEASAESAWKCPSCGAGGDALWPWDSLLRPGPRVSLTPEFGKYYPS